MNFDINKLVAAIPSAFLVILPDEPVFTIAAGSDLYMQAAGGERNQLTGKSIAEALSLNNRYNAEEIKIIHESLSYVLQNKKEHKIFLPSGCEAGTTAGEYAGRQWTIVNKPLINNSGDLEYIIHHIEENFANTTKKIAQSEERFSNLVKQTPVGIVVVTGNDFIVEIVNEFYCTIADRTAEQLIGQPIFNVIPESKEFFYPIITNVLETGKSLELYDCPFVAIMDGEKKEGFLNIVYKPYKQPDGLTTGIMILVQDVTQQVLILKKAEESEAKAQLAMQAAGLGMYDLDLATNEVITNDRYVEIMGFAQHVSREEYLKALHPGDKIRRDKAFEQALETGILDFEARIIQDDKTIHWISTKGKFINDEKGKARKLIGIIQDISEQKEFAGALEKKVSERTHELADANLKLEQSNLELQQFAYIASHDLQEPLRKVRTFAQLMEMNLSQIPEKAKSYIEKIHSSVERMQRLINDVLLFSQLSKENEEFIATDLNGILNTVIADYELLIEEKNALITSEDLPVIHCIPLQISQLFTNLVSNALKFSPAEQRPLINISAHKMSASEIAGIESLTNDETYYMIDFKDNGIGFSQEYAEQIFTIFKRLHGKKSYEGTGIGLAMCKKIVQNHHGIIYANSEANSGATFTILFPARQKVSIATANQ